MKKQKIQTAALALLLAVAMLSGCGGNSKTSAAISEDLIQETVAGAAEGGYDSSENMPGSNGSGPGLTDSADSDANSLEASMGRKLIRTVEMDVETDDFDSLLSQIDGKIKALGGYVEQSDISGRRMISQNEQLPRNAYITARVPSVKLDSFISAVEENGNVTAKAENTQDVTLQYSDLESRKKSLSIEQDRIWALLEKSDTLEAVISLEERLSEIRYELERMESQLRLYDNQVEYSSVAMRINEVQTFTPTSPETTGHRIKNGFSRNLKSVSDFLLNLFITIAAGSPIWIPLLLIAALCLYFFNRHSKRQKKAFSEKPEKALEKLADKAKGKSTSANKDETN